jgi:hypothetical protein
LISESGAADEAEKKPRKQREQRDPPPKANQPDKAAFDKMTATIEAEIEKRKKTVEGLTPQIKAETEKRNKARIAFQESLKQMKALRDVQTAASKAREAANAKLLKLETELETRKKKLDQQRKDIKFKSGDSIDAEIAQIEYQMHHTSLSLKEEKEAMAAIKALKQSKAQLAEFAEQKAAADGVSRSNHPFFRLIISSVVLASNQAPQYTIEFTVYLCLPSVALCEFACIVCHRSVRLQVRRRGHPSRAQVKGSGAGTGQGGG